MPPTNLYRHRTKRPMGSLTIGGLLGQADHLSDLVVRRFGSARRACLLSKQAIHAFFLEPLAPTPDAFFGLARGGHNGHHTEPIRTQKNNAAPPNMLLTGGRMRHDGFKPRALVGRN